MHDSATTRATSVDQPCRRNIDFVGCWLKCRFGQREASPTAPNDLLHGQRLHQIVSLLCRNKVQYTDNIWRLSSRTAAKTQDHWILWHSQNFFSIAFRFPSRRNRIKIPSIIKKLTEVVTKYEKKTTELQICGYIILTVLTDHYLSPSEASPICLHQLRDSTIRNAEFMNRYWRTVERARSQKS